MTGTPVWFGPTERPLFGMVHVPDGNTARAGVVLCSPLGREDLHVHSTYRALAERLAALGIAVLRFDYDGTGDSAGWQHDPARVAAWSASTRAALDLMRATGVPVVAAVGMRMGAAVAAVEAVREPLDALVLWDPCRSGRAFLREQRALHALSVGGDDPGDGSVQTPGFRYDPETAADLGSLDITRTDGPMAARIYLLTRPDQPVDAKLHARLERAGQVDLGPASGQHDLLNVDGQQVLVPDETVEHVATWLSSVAGDTVPLDLGAFDLTAASAVVGRDRRLRPIVERSVRIGAADLFGIVTEIEGDAFQTTVVCLNVAKERRIGPSRLWVDLARQWAGCGLRTLRVDLSGLGDSGRHPGQSSGVVYPVEALADIEDVARAMSPEDPSKIVLVGLCSGAHHAVEAGVALAAQGVCAVNPVFFTRQVPLTPTDASAPNRPPLSLPVRRWGHRMAGRRIPKAMLSALPEGAWSLINRVGVRRSPMDWLEQLVDGGTDVLIVGGADESLRIRRGATRALRGLVSSRRLRFEVIDDLEHSLLGAEDRPRVADILARHVSEHFGRCDETTDVPPGDLTESLGSAGHIRHKISP
jgi:alpha-beta hydrolase superfamily lysophospholipase